MFIDNKYTKIYFSLMEKAKQRNVHPPVIEKHHIIPKSLGGYNTVDNLVRLTPREHFIAHALLTKMVEEPSKKRSMCYAFSRMKTSNGKYNRIGNGKLYDKIQQSFRYLMCGENNPFYQDRRFAGENNPFYGKKHSEVSKRKMSQSQKEYLKYHQNSFKGKTHSDKTKSIISNAQKEPVTIIMMDGTVHHVERKKDIYKLLGISMSLGVQLCSIKRHLWSKYNIKEILDENCKYTKENQSTRI